MTTALTLHKRHLPALPSSAKALVTKKRRSHRRKSTKGRKYFFHPTVVNTGWHKDSPMSERRKAALKAHKQDYLATGRSLIALANVSQDRETKIQARKDGLYFLALHAKEN